MNASACPRKAQQPVSTGRAYMLLPTNKSPPHCDSNAERRNSSIEPQRALAFACFLPAPVSSAPLPSPPLERALPPLSPRGLLLTPPGHLKRWIWMVSHAQNDTATLVCYHTPENSFTPPYCTRCEPHNHGIAHCNAACNKKKKQFSLVGM